MLNDRQELTVVKGLERQRFFGQEGMEGGISSSTPTMGSTAECLSAQCSEPEKMSKTTQNETEPLLFEDDGPFFLLPPEEVKRKCRTGASLRRIERLREAVAMLLPAWPIQEISRHLKVSQDTLRAFAAVEAEKVSECTIAFKAALQSTAFRWLALARGREHEASFKDLVVGLGMVLDMLNELNKTGLVAEEKAAKEDERRLEAEAALQAVLAETEREAAGKRSQSCTGGFDDPQAGSCVSTTSEAAAVNICHCNR